MIMHTPRSRPAPWKVRKQRTPHRWLIPFVALEWIFEWAAFALSNWSFLEVLEYLGTFSVLIAVIFYFSESGDRVKQRHYQAWQVINTAQGKGGSGGRIEALQELNEDKVPLVGVDVSSAFYRAFICEMRICCAPISAPPTCATAIYPGSTSRSQISIPPISAAPSSTMRRAIKPICATPT